MYRIYVVLALVCVGCGTPSDVHLGERRFNRINASGDEVPSVVSEGRFYYTDPTTAMSAEGQMLWNYELARSLEAVRTATNEDELKLAKRQLEIIQSAKPADPPKVQGYIINLSGRELVCYVYSDESRARRLARVMLTTDPNPRSFYLVKGLHAHFAFVESDVEVGSYTLQNPADTGWEAWAK